MAPLHCILLIDDDPVQIFINKKLLSKLNIATNVVTANNGKDGLVKLVELNHHPQLCPQLIFLDINMPVMDGFEFVECFNELPLKMKESIKIVILSTSDNLQDLRKMNALGIQHYYHKPLNEQMIHQMIDVYQKNFYIN